MRGVGHRVVLHCVGFAQLRGRRVVAEEALVVRGDVGQRGDAIVRQRDRAGGCVVGVLAHHRFQPATQGGLLLGGQAGVIHHAAVGACPQVQHAGGFAMQPIGAPVGGDVTAMAPDRAQLHPAHRLPHLAPALDVGTRVHQLPAFADDPFGDRRLGAEDFSPGPQQHGERGDEQGGQAQPQLSRIAHDGALPRFRCMVECDGRCRIDAGQAGWSGPQFTPVVTPGGSARRADRARGGRGLPVRAVPRATNLPPGTDAGRG